MDLTPYRHVEFVTVAAPPEVVYELVADVTRMGEPPRGPPGRAWTALERRGRFDRETWRLAASAAAVVTTNAGHAATVAARLGRTAVTVPLAPNVPDCGELAIAPGSGPGSGCPADAEVVAFFGSSTPSRACAT